MVQVLSDYHADMNTANIGGDTPMTLTSSARIHQIFGYRKPEVELEAAAERRGPDAQSAESPSDRKPEWLISSSVVGEYFNPY